MEPERKIEKLLRTFAGKRREQAGDDLKLHPAMRQQLQREVARRGPPKEAGGFFRTFLAGVGPRLAFAVGCCVVGLVLFFALRPLLGRKPNTLAMNSTLGSQKGANVNRGAQPALALSPPANTSPAPPNFDSAAERDRSSSDKLQDTRSAENSENQKAVLEMPPAGTVAHKKAEQPETVASLAPAPPVESAKAVASFNSNLLDVPTNSNASAAVAEPSAPPAMSPPPAAAGTAVAATMLRSENRAATNGPVLAFSDSAKFESMAKDTSAGGVPPVSQQFYRINALAARRAIGTDGAAIPVLSSFQVEQNGLEIKITDADGSVYAGTLQPNTTRKTPLTPPAAAVETAPATVSAAALSERPQAPGIYFFRVSGTNVSLKQNVVFSGRLVPLITSARPTVGTPPAGGGGGGFGGGAGPAQSPATIPLSKAQILGRVAIGGQKEVELDASPSAR